jgi:hypothetical protein
MSVVSFVALRNFLMRGLFRNVMLVVLTLSPMAGQADDRADQPQVAAATSVAITRLRDQIEQMPLTSHLTVEEFLRRTGGADELSRALARAELVGGPRWIDADTCQVQLEMSGPRVARVLNQIAAAHPKNSPLSPGELSRATEDWDRKTYSGTGTSTAFGRVAKMRALSDSGWGSVSEPDRQKALTAAKSDAMTRVIDSIKPIRLAGGKTIGDALANTDVRNAVNDWLENRPVIRVEYRRDLQIELALAGTPGGCFDHVRAAVEKYTHLPVPDEKGWAAVREDFERSMASPTGRAEVPVAGSTVPPRSTVTTITLPDTAPSWIDRKLEAEGIADAGSKLRAAHEARVIARRLLAEEVDALKLSGGVTVGQAAEKNGRFRSAVGRALDKATSKTDYDHKNGVSVLLRLDLRDLWDALRAAE